MDTPTLPQKVSLEELLIRSFERFSSELFVSRPGSIISYDETKCLAKVQPGFKVTPRGQKSATSSPPISGVPVIFPQGSWGSIKWKLSPGDTILLLFADRNLNTWENGSGNDVDPQDNRLHSIGDAIAIPGLLPTNNVTKRNFASSNLEININGLGSITNGQKANLVLTTGTKAIIVELFTLIGAALQEIQHSTVNGNLGFPTDPILNAAMFQNIKTLLDQLGSDQITP